MYQIGTKEINAVRRVFKKGRFFRYGGTETVKFEKEWAQLIGVKSAIAVTSGTAALITGLKAMGIGPGDSVLVPVYTFISTALAVAAVGAIPIYTEIDETLTMCPDDMADKIERHTACVIPVHMMGLPCNMRAIREIARTNDILILEDACQALGGSYGRKRLGSIGDMGVFSFNEYKILACGEGGVCVTSNKKYAERAYMAQDGSCSVWPQTGKMSQAFFCGGNFRFNEISAAIMREQIKRLSGILSDLRRGRALFRKGIELPHGLKSVKSNDEPGNCGVCFLIQAESITLAKKTEAVMAKHIGVAYRPINTGRHVYSAWGVLNDRIGGHHPDWDCFRHPKNKGIKTNYRKKLKQSDDYLERTVVCPTPFGWSKQKIERAIEKINLALKEL